MISQEEKLKIAKRLNEKIKDITCPMCHQHSFIIADGYFNNTVQDHLDGLALGGTTIPTASIICANCGFVSQHSLGVLNLLPNKELNNETKKD